MPPKLKKAPKYKTSVRVVETMVFMGVCSCSWEGNRLGGEDISLALASVNSEIQAHKHIVKEK